MRAGHYKWSYFQLPLPVRPPALRPRLPPPANADGSWLPLLPLARPLSWALALSPRRELKLGTCIIRPPSVLLRWLCPGSFHDRVWPAFSSASIADMRSTTSWMLGRWLGYLATGAPSSWRTAARAATGCLAVRSPSRSSAPSERCRRTTPRARACSGTAAYRSPRCAASHTSGFAPPTGGGASRGSCSTRAGARSLARPSRPYHLPRPVPRPTPRTMAPLASLRPRPRASA